MLHGLADCSMLFLCCVWEKSFELVTEFPPLLLLKDGELGFRPESVLKMHFDRGEAAFRSGLTDARSCWFATGLCVTHVGSKGTPQLIPELKDGVIGFLRRDPSTRDVSGFNSVNPNLFAAIL